MQVGLYCPAINQLELISNCIVLVLLFSELSEVWGFGISVSRIAPVSNIGLSRLITVYRFTATFIGIIPDFLKMEHASTIQYDGVNPYFLFWAQSRCLKVGRSCCQFYREEKEHVSLYQQRYCNYCYYTVIQLIIRYFGSYLFA